MDEFAKAMQKVSKKRNKTDADHERLANLEFLGSLWLGGEGKPTRDVCFSSPVLRRAGSR